MDPFLWQLFIHKINQGFRFARFKVQIRVCNRLLMRILQIQIYIICFDLE